VIDSGEPIVIVGGLRLDLVARLDYIRVPGRDVSGGSASGVPGGRGANQAVAVARLGGQTFMIGRVGQDDPGQGLVDGLVAEGIDCTHVQATAGLASGIATRVVAESMQDTTPVASGANSAVTPADIDAAADLLGAARICLLQLELPAATVAHAIELCRSHGVETILDTAPLPAEGVPDALLRADILCPNETEASQLSGLSATKSPQAVAAALAKRGCRSLVLKLGQRGAYVSCPDGESAVPGFAIHVVDTTAAGDAFAGALAVARSWGWTLAEAARFANAAGALACTKTGGQPSMPTRREVEALIAEQ
jgi:ribokinase